MRRPPHRCRLHPSRRPCPLHPLQRPTAPPHPAAATTRTIDDDRRRRAGRSRGDPAPHSSRQRTARKFSRTSSGFDRTRACRCRGHTARQRRHPPAPQAANSPLGVWLTEEKEGKVRIEQCGANLCGYSVDKKSNQNREQVLINMKPGKDKWSGRILDPEQRQHL